MNVTIHDLPLKTGLESTDELELQEMNGGDSLKTNVHELAEFAAHHTVRPGMMMFYPEDASVLDGWLRCDGQEVSRTEYADLFAVTGVQYGAGDGGSTFRLPNRRFGAGSGYIRAIIKY